MQKKRGYDLELVDSAFADLEFYVDQLLDKDKLSSDGKKIVKDIFSLTLSAVKNDALHNNPARFLAEIVSLKHRAEAELEPLGNDIRSISIEQKFHVYIKNVCDRVIPHLEAAKQQIDRIYNWQHSSASPR